MSGQPKILAFAGSLRKDSCNKKLVKIAAEGAKNAGAEVTYIDLRDFPVPIYDQEIEASEGIPANAQKFKDLLLENQGLLIASPEYNSSISGVLKNLIDWASRPSKKDEAPLVCFKGKAAVLMSASPSQLGGLRGLVHLKAILGNIEVIVLPQQQTIANAYEAFSPEGKLLNERHQTQVEQLGVKLTDFLKKFQKS